MERIGFIGIGAMGRPMSSNIVKAGYPLTVYDIVADATKSVVELGASAAGSVAEATEASDIIFTMLPQFTRGRRGCSGTRRNRGERPRGHDRG